MVKLNIAIVTNSTEIFQGTYRYKSSKPKKKMSTWSLIILCQQTCRFIIKMPT
jgi:hypothetical protein